MKDKKRDIGKIILDAHRRGVKDAYDLSIRTGVPLVIAENGKIKKLKPTKKYILVDIEKKKSSPSAKKKISKK